MSNKYKLPRRRLLAVAVAGLLGAVASVAMAATPTHAPYVRLLQPTTLLPGHRVMGAKPVAQTVHVTLALKLRNQAALDAFLARAKAPATPASERTMSHGQLAANYLPTAAQAGQVAAFLRSAGFRNVRIHPNNLLVSGDATVGAVQGAFKTTLANVRTRDGRLAFANTSAVAIPASLKGIVSAVLGLQTVHQNRTLAYPPPANSGVGLYGHTPMALATIYGASSLPAATDVSVGVLGWGSMQQTVTDLGTFLTDTGLSAGTVSVVCTDYQGTPGAVSTTDPTCSTSDMGATEWDMDSQTIVGMSGGVKSLTFYAAPSGLNSQSTDQLNELLNPTSGVPTPQVLNASYGECERWEDANQGGDGSAQADDAIFQALAAEGVTVAAATGDSGSDECGDGQMNSASYPASSPWVVAVAGTTLRASDTTLARQNVWALSGGSPSSFASAQPWQAGLTYGTYAGMRGPDVAFDANPATGAVFILGGSVVRVGGTSLATPIFSGAWARILQSDPNLGFAAPQLYKLHQQDPSVFMDVTMGNNGQYAARRGWDWATGLGSFNVANAAAAMAGWTAATPPPPAE